MIPTARKMLTCGTHGSAFDIVPIIECAVFCVGAVATERNGATACD